MEKTHVIIGTSAAAIGCLNKLRSLDPDSEIICISAEPEFPYNKCFLVDLWAGDKAEALIATKKPEFFEENNIRLMLGKRVISILPEQKSITLDDGQQISFDTLLISTGSRARKLNIPGFLRQAQDEREGGVFYFHTLNDTQRIMQFIKEKNPRTAVVIGSGFTGLEVADVLQEKGIKTTVVERGPRVLGSFLNENESALIQDAMKKRGVIFIGGEEVNEIGINTITLKSGKTLQVDLIIIAIGVVPNSQLAHEADIELYHGGIKTNEHLQTNIPNVFAAGDVATVKDQLSGNLVRSCMWADAMQQGMIAAHGMAGIKKEYPGVMTTGISTFFGLDIMVSGSTHSKGKQVVCQTKQSYRKYILKDSKLKIFTMIGKLEKVGVARRALMNQQKVDMKELE